MATRKKPDGGGKAKASANAGVLEQIVADAAEGATAVLPPGKYKLGEPLRIERGLTLRGDGVTVVAPKGKNAIVVAASAPVIIQGLAVEGSLASAIESQGSNLTLRGCVLRGPGYTKERDGMNGVHGRGGKLSVAECSFEGFDAGVCVDDKGSGEITDVTTRGNDTGVFVTGGASARVCRVKAEDNRMGILFHEAGSGEITDCDATGNQVIGIGAQGATVDVSVSGCRIRDGKEYGMHFAGAGHVRVVRNVVDGGPIHVSLDTEAEVVGNVVSGSKGVGIFFTRQARGVVRHNFVTGGKNNGIDVWGDATPRVRDNVCIRNAFAGIAVTGNSAASVTFNFARNNQQNGVWVHGESKATVARNDLTENENNGILAYEKCAPTLRANHCELNTFNGIFVSGEAAPLVEGNSLVGNSLNGFGAGDQARPIVRKNRSHRNACDGFRLDDATRAVLEENVASDNQEDGISILKTAAPRLRANRCERNEGAAIRVVGAGAKPTLDGDTFSGNGEDKVVRVKAPSGEA